jgi:alkylation response protein AidB-like acyl-CoA dehydrogenase
MEDPKRMSDVKMWGAEPYGGLGYDFDPQWYLTDEQKTLQEKLIELCRTTLRPNAIEFDRNGEFPRKNMEALASLGLLSLPVPKKYGGLGEGHVAIAMALETIGRYGCSSTCLVYAMHLLATSALLLRAKGNPEIEKVLRRLDKDVFIGTSAYSDPETGSHFWYPKVSSAERTEGGFRISKKGSWVTSGGFADFYVAQTTSPDFNGNYADLSVFLVYKDEIAASPAEWDAMGMRGNQSGPVEIKDLDIPHERMIGPAGDGGRSNDEAVDPIGLIMLSASYNGIALGAIDIAKMHTTRKLHADVGLRVCDYPTIQDYVGEAIMDTQASRLYTFEMARRLDEVTNRCDWSIHEDDLTVMPRAHYLPWLWQTKFIACKNVSLVTDRMMQACGGTGYKRALGVERLVRDGKAGWVMGPTNEVLRQFVGKLALLGPASLDWWNQNVNERVLHNELKKLDAEGKRKLIAELEADLKAGKGG